MSATEKAAGPVTPQDLESMALRVAQARSTLHVIANSSEDEDAATLHNSLALVVEYLQDCAEDLSELHRRHQEAQS